MKSWISAVGAALTLAVCLSVARADTSRAIAFQGDLDGAAGSPLPAGVYHNVVFRLYASATGGTAIWTETRDVTVSGSHGVSSVALGSVTPFPDTINFNSPLWVGVQVGADAEMTPRLALSNAPVANALALPYTGYEGANPDLVRTDAAAFTIRSSLNIAITGVGRRTGLWGVTQSSDPRSAGVEGLTLAGGIGVYGVSKGGIGVYGETYSTAPGVFGTGWGDGVQGTTENPGTAGVKGQDTSSKGGFGMVASSAHGIGLKATSDGGDAAQASTTRNGASGVYARDDSGSGGFAMTAYSAHGVAINAWSDGGSAVQGATFRDGSNGVAGYDNGPTGGNAVYGSSAHGWSGYFTGKVHVGSLNPAGSDVAEEFATSGDAAPGTVMVIDPAHPGTLRPAATAYDRKVAGVVSGANGVKTGIVLPDVDNAEGARPVAMTGRVWVRCNTGNGTIQPGDMLTTSDTPGEAMKVLDYPRAQGATIGKAMTALTDKDGLVLALISLQWSAEPTKSPRPRSNSSGASVSLTTPGLEIRRAGGSSVA